MAEYNVLMREAVIRPEIVALRESVESSKYDRLVYEDVPQSDYVMSIPAGSQEVKGINIVLSTALRTWIVHHRMDVEAVYVRKTDNGQEELVYNSNMMVKGKQYPVVWDGDHYLLIKEDNAVEFYKFHPDENDNRD